MHATTTEVRAARQVAAKPKLTEKKPWKRIVAATVAAVLLVSGSVWAWKHYSHLARLRKAEQLLAAAAQNRAGQPGSPGQRRFGLDENTRNSIDALGLTQAERDQLSAARREEARRRRQEEMDRFLAMSEKERAALAQKRAAEMAKQLDQKAAAAAKNGGQAGNASSGNSPGNSANAGARGPRTPDQRLQGQKWRLDNTTPQERAQRTLYNAALAKAIAAQNSVREGQGLPPIPMPRTRSM